MKYSKHVFDPICDWLDEHLMNLETDNFSDNIDDTISRHVTFPDHATVEGETQQGTACGLLNLDIENYGLVEAKFPYNSVNEAVSQVKQHYGLPETVIVDSDLGHMISVSLKGNHVHEHLDDSHIQKGQHHVRFNVMFRKADGGEPVMENETYNVPELKVWVCEAGHVLHSTTEIKCGVRYLLSMGFWLCGDDLLKVRRKQLIDGDKTWFNTPERIEERLDYTWDGTIPKHTDLSRPDPNITQSK